MQTDTLMDGWQAGRFRLDLTRPRVMAIVNLTPDSFSDGGQHLKPDAALAHAQRCVENGADILDLGAESTRPGAAAVTADEEWDRLAPVVGELVRWGIPISVDTRRTEVMRRALEMGADIINDVQALQAPGAEALLASHPSVGVCLMHMQGEPATMQQQLVQGDVVDVVGQWLVHRAAAVQAAGVAADRILLDPGIGFAKSVEQNLDLLRHQSALAAQLPRPLLVGWSRKSTLGQVTGRARAADRVAASVAAALLSVQAGAAVVRVHDVAQTVDALRLWQVIRPSGTGPQSAT